MNYINGTQVNSMNTPPARKSHRLIVAVNRLSIFSMISFLLTFSCTDVAMGQAGPAENLKLPKGFKAELLYSVPEEQGSWVSMTYDPKGRLIASDQYGKLYRITPTGDGSVDVEEIELTIGFAQGLLCAFDSLYVVSFGIDPNAKGKNKAKNLPKNQAKMPAGLYRVRDTDYDDKYDNVELLREFVGKSEHGPHAVILSPDKKSLFICAGNATQIPKPETSRVPLIWQEDQVLTRLPDARGHAAGRLAPGGWICKTDPDGKSFELVATGFRNEYDIAFDPNGELFTFDADMEWDVGLPWYRPTRVCHVVSGSEFGWRHGSGKWPEYYPDSVPPVLNIGPGSPTGITFGTGAKFPASYQNALFISDWSYGMIYAVRMEPDGSTYKGTKEKFCSAPALPVTDLVINPTDGAMYFLIGGRRSQSALYRITYVGDESTAAVSYPPTVPAVAVRRKLESFHAPGAKLDVDYIWDRLGDEDRLVRYAARTALELQPLNSWSDRAFQETDPQRILELMTAVARLGGNEKQAAVVTALSQLDWNSLTPNQRVHLIRAYGLVLCRLGEPTAQTKATIQELAQHFPTREEILDRELAKLLIAVGFAEATEAIVNLLLSPSAQEPQIAYAMMLSDAKTGWNQSLREKYFEWFLESAKSKGGPSFGGYIDNVRQLAIENLSDSERLALASTLNKKAEIVDPYADLKARPLVKQWTMDDLLPTDDTVFANRDLANGKKMFVLASCYRCHRMEGQGGIVGPDLTPAGHRFNTKDLIETIIDPSREISDQYEATIFLMEDGQMITGRVANLSGNQYSIQKDMIDPGNFTKINVDEIEAMKPSKVSMMPIGLLDTLTKDDIFDLLAYLKTVGKRAAELE
jgi:putative heme-binding domain-containing protein